MQSILYEILNVFKYIMYTFLIIRVVIVYIYSVYQLKRYFQMGMKIGIYECLCIRMRMFSFSSFILCESVRVNQIFHFVLKVKEFFFSFFKCQYHILLSTTVKNFSINLNKSQYFCYWKNFCLSFELYRREWSVR